MSAVSHASESPGRTLIGRPRHMNLAESRGISADKGDIDIAISRVDGNPGITAPRSAHFTFRRISKISREPGLHGSNSVHGNSRWSKSAPCRTAIVGAHYTKMGIFKVTVHGAFTRLENDVRLSVASYCNPGRAVVKGGASGGHGIDRDSKVGRPLHG